MTEEGSNHPDVATESSPYRSVIEALYTLNSPPVVSFNDVATESSPSFTKPERAKAPGSR